MVFAELRQRGGSFLQSVRLKVTIAVTLVLIVILGLSAAWRYERHRAMDLEEAQAQSRLASSLIVASLQHAMMTYDPTDIQSIIDNVSHQTGVRGTYLFDTNGGLLAAGAQAPPGLQPTALPGTTGSEFTTMATGERIVRQWNTIENEPRCYSCHPAQQAVLGTLIADYSMAETDHQLAIDLQASVTGVVATMLAVIIAINVLLSRFVLDKVEQFVPILQSYGGGDLKLRIPPCGKDEIGELAIHFNEMADSLEVRAAENARLYHELADKEAARTFLLHKAIAAQEEERKYLARELHDDFAQSLTALSITVESALQSIPSDMMSVHDRLDRVQELAQETLAETSRWIQALRPHVLDDLGLLPALRAFAETRFEESGTRVQFEVCNLPERLPPDVEITLFRVLQEALSNVRRHADALQVKVRIEQFANHMLVAHVEDDGIGFLPGRYLNPRDDLRGMGLLGMRERIALLGGTLTIESTPGRGTRLRVEIPLKSAT